MGAERKEHVILLEKNTRGCERGLQGETSSGESRFLRAGVDFQKNRWLEDLEVQVAKSLAETVLKCTIR